MICGFVIKTLHGEIRCLRMLSLAAWPFMCCVNLITCLFCTRLTKRDHVVENTKLYKSKDISIPAKKSVKGKDVY